MARLLGSEYRLFVGDGATPTEAFTLVAGQRDLTIDASTNLIDVSSKETGIYTLQRPGRSAYQISVTGVMVLPDTAGLEAVYAAYKSRSAVNFEIRDGAFGDSDVAFAASMNVSNFNRGNPDEAEATYSFDLTLDAAPTTDLLGS